MLITLRDARPERCGAKATTLGRLLTAGLPVPDGVVVPFDAPAANLDRLAAEAWSVLGPGPLAVRSSADGEDSADASMAGQHTTVLGAHTPSQVADAIRACRASASSDRAAAYRQRLGRAEPRMAVLIQRLVPADVAGVMFVTADGAVIEAGRGLGTAVVEGRVTPERIHVDADGAIHRPPTDAHTDALLDDDAVTLLVGVGRRVSTLLGGTLDVEWAVASGSAWILQARPITAPLPEAAAHTGTTALSPGATRLTGSPGSGGVTTGPARVVHGPADFARVRRGDVLVCPYTDPAWTPLLAVAAGVVTRTGGMLSHAAIVAREHAIPAVLGVADALDRITDGDLVTVDGDAGTVTLRRPA
ncbi:Pyruvate, water dikinase [Xylanimonas cellulosilytica DSM 15894]|uniref:Pyruvate, water dikinase n=1 Tax=Xylanimonas cellulosilytica (strain DSM 15894 / JCM 12276 / CECT 5975 / KCTC 9989 / LMG 20990 / NBRC 107835 / XIL07) TaxID=446471 RepID=D1BWA2_XYLCX|nr:PEP/pyruvate-binding domain-containing protein [Xylanimonas cellulosilytica]ACZ31447.1 Pyruvate, water dikinase [Xylanimonas cellulosilytica DSM 15894]